MSRVIIVANTTISQAITLEATTWLHFPYGY